MVTNPRMKPSSTSPEGKSDTLIVTVELGLSLHCCLHDVKCMGPRVAMMRPCLNMTLAIEGDIKP